MLKHLLLAATLATPASAAVVPLTPDLPNSAPQPAFEEGITRTDQLPTLELRRLRKSMLRGDRLSFQDMRKLADAGDGLAAFRYGRRLVALDDPDVLPAAALYFASAAYSGRDYAVRPLVQLLEEEDMELSERRLVHLENALRAFAIRGNVVAEQALVRFYEQGEPFGYHPERAQSLMLAMAEAGNGEAALALATQAMSGVADLPPEEVRALLQSVAENASSLGRRTMARNLLDQFNARMDDP